MAKDTAIVTIDLNTQTHTHEIASRIYKSLPYFAARNLAILVYTFRRLEVTASAVLLHVLL